VIRLVHLGIDLPGVSTLAKGLALASARLSVEMVTR
jgi:hypothetical protein